MKICCGKSACGPKNCGGPCHEEHQCGGRGEGYHGKCSAECRPDKAHLFLELADCAWMEVLKEKIKEQIKATKGDRINELAKIIAEGNHHRWKQKMAGAHQCREFEGELCCYFGGTKNKK